MKLHRIGATNLNSLYGEQTVDLDAHLNGASLFLIQGPTGSGKSTLMDAISLALFGTTPRLDKLRSEQAVAEQVMSRGEGTAQALVEFSKWESGQRVRYRATWMARRSRDKAEGRMQATTRSLERYDSDGNWVIEVSDHRSKVVQPAFDRVLEQFTPHDFQRSMLLAQGNFDAMLHADPEERAAILERLTNTAEYQRWGERAARMRGAWEGRLAGLRARRDAISPVGEEALAEAKAAVDAGKEVAKGLEADHARLTGWRDWLVRAAVLDGDVQAAGEALAKATQASEAAADSLGALAEHERCVDAFECLDRRAGVAARVKGAGEELERVVEGLPALVEVAAQAGAQQQSAKQATTQAEAALGALRGPAGEAAEAAGKVATAEEEKRSADQAQAEALGKFGQAEERERAAEAGLKRAQEAVELASKQFEELAADAPLVEGLPDMEHRAAGIVEARKALATAQAHDAKGAAEITAKTEALQLRRQAHEAARNQQLVPLKDAVDAAAEALGERSGGEEPTAVVAALRGLHEARLTRGAALDAAAVAVGVRDVAAGKRAQRLDEERVAALAVGVQEERVVEGKRAEAQASAALVASEAALVPLERIAALGEQRAQLEPGDPCPLCGALDHPFVDDPARRAQAEAIEQAVREARSARDEAVALRDQATGAREAAEVGLAEARTEARGAVARREEAEAALVDATQRATEALAKAELEPSSTAEAVAVEVDRVHQADRASQDELAAVDGAITAQRTAIEALDRAKQSLAETEAQLERDQAKLEQAGAEREARQEALRAQASELAERRSALAADLARFGIEAQPAEEGLAAAQARGRAWELARVSRDEARTAADKAEAARVAAVDALKTAREVEHQCRQAAVVRGKNLDLAKAEALGATELLGQAWDAAVALDDAAAAPRPPAQSAPHVLVRSQEGRVEALQRAVDVARGAREAADSAVTTARSRQSTLQERVKSLEAEHIEHQAALQRLLATLQLPDEAALGARRLPPEVLERSRAQRQSLRDLRSTAQANQDAVRLQHDRHLEQRPADLPDDATPDALDPQLTELAAARSAHQDSLSEARTTLQMAERDRDARAGVDRELAAATAQAAVWLHLHDLIGIGDGKRFKLFAQALNLNQLLVQANRHLVHLNERYRLLSERDPDTGLPTLEFVVQDQWRPGTTRSLKTLSGGESFLVSLALALGLSDLRTSSMPVETLLLDEGFGTLDPQTLDTALAALQQLQAAGRQVGIISHVVGLQERIEARVLVEPVGEGRSRVRAQLGPG